MFYYENWENFCAWIVRSGFPTCTAEESLELSSGSDRHIILKHDVEANVPCALELARIEHAHGICGSYYVQAYLLRSESNVRMLAAMRDMGHEISYHYDVLDANNGNYEKAEAEFDRWLSVFHSLEFKFKTICQHGNPVKKRIGYTSNRDFFRNMDIRNRHENLVDLVVNYSNHVVFPYIYISDAGYMWKHIVEPETNDLNPHADTIVIGDFNKLEDYISNAECTVILSTHPHRWMKSSLKIGVKIKVFHAIRSSVMILRRVPFVNTLLNRFYFLAKRI